MEVLEFMKQKNRMCDYYVDGCTRDGFCEICPAHDIDCEITTDKPEQLVAIVEQWVKEHPEKPEQERQNPEQDDIEGAIYREIISHKTRIENLEHDVFVIRNNLALLGDQIYALHEKVYHTQTEGPSQTTETKRTNKDVLLAVLPNVDTSACPQVLDMNYKCDKRKLCAVCKHEFWNEEVKG